MKTGYNRFWIVMAKCLAQEATLEEQRELGLLIEEDVEMKGMYLRVSDFYRSKKNLHTESCTEQFKKLHHRISNTSKSKL